MGNSINNQELRFHGKAIHKHSVPYFNIMLSWLSDILDKQIGLLETKGAWVTVPIFGITSYIFAWFANIHGLTDSFDIVKNIILSLIGIGMAAMGAVNTYIGMRIRIKKWQDSRSEKKITIKKKKMLLNFIKNKNK